MKMILLLLIITGTINCLWDHEQAIVLAQKGNTKDALQAMDQLLVDDPFNSELLYDAGVLAYKNKEYQQALHYFQQAAQYVPKQSPLKELIHFNAGNAQVKNNALEIALDEYKKVLKINPDNEKAAHNIKKVEEMLKKQQEEQKEQEKNKQNEQQSSQDEEHQDHHNDDPDNQKNNDQENGENHEDRGDQQKQQQQSNNQNNADQGTDKKQNNKGKDGQNKKDRSGNEQDAENREQQNNTKDDANNDESRRHTTEKKQSEQKDQQKSGASEATDTQEKNDAAQPSDDEHQEQKAPALNSQLARVMQKHGDADANLNKQFIKLIVDQQAKRNNDGPQW